MRFFRGAALASCLGLAVYTLVAFAAAALVSPPTQHHDAHAQSCTVPHPTWHGPTDHEHGDAPPAWVLASAWQPFTQCREGHRLYKGFVAPMQNGVEGYLISHVGTIAAARSHGDHDYQLWVKEPSGAVSHWAGIMCFAAPVCAGQPILLSDPPKPFPRPSIVQDTNPAKFAENWTTALGMSVFELEWYVLPQNEDFLLTFHGLGTKRGMNFNLFVSRFPGPGAVYVSPTLSGLCAPAGPNCNFSYRDVNNLRDYSAPGLAVPN